MMWTDRPRGIPLGLEAQLEVDGLEFAMLPCCMQTRVKDTITRWQACTSKFLSQATAAAAVSTV
jgi:hypothetical protein